MCEGFLCHVTSNTYEHLIALPDCPVWGHSGRDWLYSFHIPCIFLYFFYTLAILKFVLFSMPQIKESHRQEEKAFKDFCDYVDRTSDYAVLTVRAYFYDSIVR